MVRGRTTAPVGMVLGHEITGEIAEIGKDVQSLKVGDIVSVPFNVAYFVEYSNEMIPRAAAHG